MSLLHELMPKRQQRVIDLVSQAGIDVTDWANYKNGQDNPGANPRYCYEWAFVKSGTVIVLNLWYDSIHEIDGRVEQHFNLRDSAASQEKNGVRRARRRRMEKAIELAYMSGLPVRVIVLSGNRRVTQATTGKPATVSARALDPVPWAVLSFNDKTGDILLRRGASAVPYADQFSLSPPPDGSANMSKVTATVRNRSAEVRQYVLLRAKGKCELCGYSGFQLSNGNTYLETHHVISLAKGGPDSVKNVVALCPNHHREAHYGNEALHIRKRLLTFLESL
jgi:hypothetical protein